MVSDSSNNIICALSDNRNGESNIYIYKISTSGHFLWGYSGIELSLPGDDVEPKLTSTSGGSVIVTWTNGSKVAMQGLHHSGQTNFGSNPRVLEDPSDEISFSAPQVVLVENETFILKYCIDNGGEWTSNRHIYAQKYDQGGSAIWNSPAVICNTGGISYDDKVLPIVTDSQNGIYLGWHDDRDETERPSAYIQYVSSSGAVQYENGLSLYSSDSLISRDIQVAYDDINDKVYAVWTSHDDGNYYHSVYGQKIANHEVQWEENGAPILVRNLMTRHCIGLFAVDGEAIVLYKHSPFETNYFNILAVKFNSEATVLWDTPKEIKNTHSSVDNYEILLNNSDEIIITYESEYYFVNEFDKSSIYVQNMC